jgi:hypothetical protein
MHAKNSASTLECRRQSVDRREAPVSSAVGPVRFSGVVSQHHELRGLNKVLGSRDGNAVHTLRFCGMRVYWETAQMLIYVVRLQKRIGNKRQVSASLA